MPVASAPVADHVTETVTIPSIYAKIGDTLIIERHDRTIEGEITGMEITKNRGEITDYVKFALDGVDAADIPRLQLRQYVTLRRAVAQPSPHELTRIVHPTVPAYLYRDCLILAMQGAWRIRFRDGSGHQLFGPAFHMRTEDEWRREAIRVIDAFCDGEMKAAANEWVLLEAKFLEGESFEGATVAPKEVPVELTHGVYSYRGYTIKAEPYGSNQHRTSCNITIVPPMGRPVVIRSRDWGTNYDEQAKTAARHIDENFDL